MSIGSAPQHNQPAPSLRQSSTFDDRIEALFRHLVSSGNFTKSAVGFSYNALEPAIELVESADLSASEQPFLDKVEEGRQMYWDSMSLPSIYEITLLLAEAEARSAKHQAIIEIQQAAYDCECVVSEPDEPPDPADALWTVRKGTPDVGGSVRAMSLNYAGDQLALGVNNSVIIGSSPDLTAVTTFSVPHTVTALHYDPSGQQLLVGSLAGNLRVFDTSTWQETTAPITLPGAFIGQTVNPTGTETIVIHGNPVPGAKIYTLPDYTLMGEVGDRLPGYNPLQGFGATYSHDGSWVALAGFSNNEIRVVSTSDWSQQVTGLPALDGRIKALAYTKDDAYIGIVQQLPAGYTGGQLNIMLLDTTSWSLQALSGQPSASATWSELNQAYAAVTTMDPSGAVSIFRTSDWQPETTESVQPAWVCRWIGPEVLAVGTQGGLVILVKRGSPPEILAVEGAATTV